MRAKFSLACGLAALIMLAACGDSKAPTASTEPPQPAHAQKAATHGKFDASKAGTPAPDTPLETGPDGRTETIADIAKANPGKKILVNLWATWCAPCLKELPTLDALAADTADRLVIVPVSQDMEGWRKVTPAFTHPNLSTRLESQMQLGLALGAKGMPITILYDDQAREIWRYAGDFDWNSAEARAKLAL
jgi:thiol-disulfide isomerase/thioredoxin